LVLATLAALALGVLLLGVAGCNLAGTSLAGLAGVTSWRVASTSSLAKSLAVAAAGLVLILVALPRLGRNRLVALAGSVITMASFALTGHAATAAPPWLMRCAVPLHALGAAFWLGALPLLIAAVRAGPAGDAHRLVARFSAQAVVVVAVILMLGVAIALVQIGHVAMLWQTPYGIVLMGKLAAVALLLGVAAHNKWHATPRLAGGGASAKGAFLRAIAAEYLLFAAIVAFTAALGQIEPPRAVVERDTRALTRGQADFVASATEAGRTITLSVAPSRAGHNALAVEVTDAAGQLMLPQEVTLEMSLPSAGIEPLRRKAEREPSGHFIYHSHDLALAGRWRIDVHVLVDDFTKAIASFDVPIR
jgi:copper transport protein